MSSDPPLTSAGLSLVRQVSMEVKLSAVRQAHDRGQSLTAWGGRKDPAQAAHEPGLEA